MTINVHNDLLSDYEILNTKPYANKHTPLHINTTLSKLLDTYVYNQDIKIVSTNNIILTIIRVEFLGSQTRDLDTWWTKTQFWAQRDSWMELYFCCWHPTLVTWETVSTILTDDGVPGVQYFLYLFSTLEKWDLNWLRRFAKRTYCHMSVHKFWFLWPKPFYTYILKKKLTIDLYITNIKYPWRQ